MSSSTISVDRQFDQEREVWESLKQAIATSSGFKQWQQGKETDPPIAPSNLDRQIRSYLRETLETLAY